jgi:hypothetical protein
MEIDTGNNLQFGCFSGEYVVFGLNNLNNLTMTSLQTGCYKYGSVHSVLLYGYRRVQPLLLLLLLLLLVCVFVPQTCEA